MCVSVPYEITLLSNVLYGRCSAIVVSVPYEITLLSNDEALKQGRQVVSVPYEITLLSNKLSTYNISFNVSVPYEITLLSNFRAHFLYAIWFQYLMKLHYSQTLGVIGAVLNSFSTL